MIVNNIAQLGPMSDIIKPALFLSQRVGHPVEFNPIAKPDKDDTV